MSNGAIHWLSVSDMAAHFNKTPHCIRLWIRKGFMVNGLGYPVRRDPTGHWQIGVPATVLHGNTVITVSNNPHAIDI